MLGTRAGARGRTRENCRGIPWELPRAPTTWDVARYRGTSRDTMRTPADAHETSRGRSRENLTMWRSAFPFSQQMFVDCCRHCSQDTATSSGGAKTTVAHGVAHTAKSFINRLMWGSSRRPPQSCRSGAGSTGGQSTLKPASLSPPKHSHPTLEPG